MPLANQTLRFTSMIDSSKLNAYPATPLTDTGSKPRFHMKRDPDARMAGSIPVWENPRQPALNSTKPDSFETALGYAESESPAGNAAEASDTETFGFGDLVDIVNPLHHIPLVSALYEGMTGDDIKPSGRIIGGALFGGFVGAAAGVANVIVEEETGKDVTGNVVAFVTKGDLPQTKREALSPEEHLNQAARMAFSNIDAEPLPAIALSMSPPKSEAAYQETAYERFTPNDERTAGTMVRRISANSLSVNPLPPAVLADPVSVNLAEIRASQQAGLTQVTLSPLPENN